jgi:hypothetical protein
MVAFVVRNRGAHSSFYFSRAIGRPVVEAAQVLLSDSAGHKVVPTSTGLNAPIACYVPSGKNGKQVKAVYVDALAPLETRESYPLSPTGSRSGSWKTLWFDETNSTFRPKASYTRPLTQHLLLIPVTLTREYGVQDGLISG